MVKIMRFIGIRYLVNEIVKIMKFIGIMLKLLTAVCLGMPVISRAMNNGAVPSSFLPQAYVPIDSSLQYRSNDFENNGQYSPPVMPQQADPVPTFVPYPPFGTRNLGKLPLAPPNPQMNVANAVSTNPTIYQYNTPTYPRISPNQQQPSHCENSEILFKIWTIFLNLLDTRGEVKNSDIEKVKLALKLIKEYIEKAPRNAQDFEVANKLMVLERDLLKNKDSISESKRAFRTVDDNIEPNDPVISIKHKLPENANPNCIEELAKVIQTAQKSYINLTKSPICSAFDNPEAFLRRSDLPVTLINPANFRNQYKRANFPNRKNLSANNVALKASLDLLMNQSNYNAHDVFELLQNFKPIQTAKSPPIDAIEPVVNDSNPFNPNQTKSNSSQTSYNNYQQLPGNLAINDLTNDTKASIIDPLNPNEIELTYALKRPQPLVYQPFYFIKYRLPFNSFLKNLERVTHHKSTDTSKSELYKSVIESWNADEISPDLVHFTKQQVNDLVIKEGNLVEAILIQNKGKNLRLNLNTPKNLEAQLSEYNFNKDNTDSGDGKHLIEVQISPYQTVYSSDDIDESKRKKFKSDIRPGLDDVTRLPRYPSMFQKGPPPSPLKSYSDHLLYKSAFGKAIPAPNLPSPLIET